MNWNLIADALPTEKQEVLLRWAVPDMPSIFRLGADQFGRDEMLAMTCFRSHLHMAMVGA